MAKTINYNSRNVKMGNRAETDDNEGAVVVISYIRIDVRASL